MSEKVTSTYSHSNYSDLFWTTAKVSPQSAYRQYTLQYGIWLRHRGGVHNGCLAHLKGVVSILIKDDSVLASLKEIRKEALTKLYLENSTSSYHGCHPDIARSFPSESISAIKKLLNHNVCVAH